MGRLPWPAFIKGKNKIPQEKAKHEGKMEAETTWRTSRRRNPPGGGQLPCFLYISLHGPPGGTPSLLPSLLSTGRPPVNPQGATWRRKDFPEFAIVIVRASHQPYLSLLKTGSGCYEWWGPLIGGAPDWWRPWLVGAPDWLGPLIDRPLKWWGP